MIQSVLFQETDASVYAERAGDRTGGGVQSLLFLCLIAKCLIAGAIDPSATVPNKSRVLEPKLCPHNFPDGPFQLVFHTHTQRVGHPSTSSPLSSCRCPEKGWVG